MIYTKSTHVYSCRIRKQSTNPLLLLTAIPSLGVPKAAHNFSNSQALTEVREGVRIRAAI